MNDSIEQTILDGVTANIGADTAREYGSLIANLAADIEAQVFLAVTETVGAEAAQAVQPLLSGTRPVGDIATDDLRAMRQAHTALGSLLNRVNNA